MNMTRTAHLPASSGVYAIQNNKNGKMYIGQSKNVRARCVRHLRELRGGFSTCTRLVRAFLKHGESEFTISVLHVCPPDKLDWVEAALIQYYCTTNQEFGYNIKSGGSSSRGYKLTLTDDERQRRAQAMSDQQADKRFRRKTRAKWKDPDFRERQRAAVSKFVSRLHADPEFKAGLRLRKSRELAALHKDPEFSARHTRRSADTCRKRWQDPTFRAARLADKRQRLLDIDVQPADQVREPSSPELIRLLDCLKNGIEIHVLCSEFTNGDLRRSLLRGLHQRLGWGIRSKGIKLYAYA